MRGGVHFVFTISSTCTRHAKQVRVTQGVLGIVFGQKRRGGDPSGLEPSRNAGRLRRIGRMMRSVLSLPRLPSSCAASAGACIPKGVPLALRMESGTKTHLDLKRTHVFRKCERFIPAN